MDDSWGYILFGLVGLVIYLVILYSVIRSANDTTQRDKIQLQNQKILALIAEKIGVDVAKLNNILKP